MGSAELSPSCQWHLHEATDSSNVEQRRPRTMPCSVERVPLLATMIHMIAFEWLPLWIFWFGYNSLITSMTTYLMLWYVEIDLENKALLFPGIGDSLPRRGVDNLGEYVFCLQNDVNVASWSLDLNFRGICVEFDNYNVLGVANYSCLLLCFVLVFGSMLAVLLSRGADLRTGKYLAGKWDFERNSFYRCLVILLLMSPLSCMACAAYVSGTTLRTRAFVDLLQAFLYYGADSTLVTIASAYALLPSWHPRFDYHTDAFQHLRFRRTWYDVFCSSSIAFYQQLEEAILLAQSGSWQALRELLEEPNQAEELVRACEISDSLSTASSSATESTDAEAEASGSEAAAAMVPRSGQPLLWPRSASQVDSVASSR
ncbi:unnamed protein product [Effrenium voratum]|uniref:Transmembrane protein n=2 Tax=Effrenium voratum TaxID=2562239 RepID=A0AA36HMX4_9DINO|nr:unnamed protein product [Effrenium voratum]